MILKKYCNCLVYILIFSLCEVYCDEKSSLTFVIDETLSMKADIKQVLLGVNRIFDAVINSTQSQIEDFILITFHDNEQHSWGNFPDRFSNDNVNQRVITKDRSEFKNALSQINLYDGGDCPEFSMSGIMKGIKSSRPRSTIYVFTDSQAKDYKKFEDVKNKAVQQQSTVTFVLTTSHCPKTGPSYAVYQDLADATSGTVFDVHKTDVQKIITDITLSIQGRRTVLVNIRFKGGQNECKLNFVTDYKNKDPVVTITGKQPILVSVFGPDGRKADTKIMVQTSKVLIVSIVDSKPGAYAATVGCRHEAHVKVTAQTEIIFQHGFSTSYVSTFKDAATRPLPDVDSHIYIQVTDGNIVLQTVKLIDYASGREQKSLHLTLFNKEEQLYITEPVHFLQNMPLFILNISGYDPATKEKITRTGPPIAVQLPPPVVYINKAPEVTIQQGASVNVDYNGGILLTCKVVAYPAPEIVWTSATGHVLNNKKSEVELHEYNSYLKLSNVTKSESYYCKASNTVARNKLSKVDVIPWFVVKSALSEITRVKFGEKKILQCDIFSSYPMDIKWKTPLKPSEYSLSADKKVLTINSVKTDSQGKYTCEVTLTSNPTKKHNISTRLLITNLARPSISDASPGKISVLHGAMIQISCKIVEGVPPPTVSWQLMRKGDNRFRDMFATVEELTIDSAMLSDAGQYRCIATNEKGEAHKTTEVVVLKTPTAYIDGKATVTVPYGSTKKFQCQIEAYPPPSVVWKDSKGNKLNSKETTYNFEVVSQLNVQNIIASDTYSCHVTNNLGMIQASVNVLVLPAIKYPQHHKEIIGVNHKKPANILCEAEAQLPIKIKWFYQKNDASERSEIHTSDKYQISPDERTLHITSVDLDLVGKYTCEASLKSNQNENILITTEVKITNLKAPEITLSDNIITVMNGQRTSPICKIAGGVPPPTVSWQVMRKGDNEYRDLLASGEELTIDNATLADAGQYRCIATNEVGKENKTTEVVVLKAPTVYIDGKATVTVPYGSTNEFKCRIEAYPPPSVVWKDSKGNKLNSQEITYNFEVVSQLNLQNIASDIYSCHAKNNLGTTQARVNVLVLPAIQYPKHHKGIIGVNHKEPANILCEAKAQFPIKIKWFYQKNDASEKSEIHASDKYQISPDESTLHITSVDLDLVGKYSCEASLLSNKKENTLITTLLQIDNLKAPEITYSDKNITIMTGLKMTVICKANGVPEPTITWQFKSKYSDIFAPIPNIGEQLSNPDISYEWAGLYKCTAKNELGTQSRTVEVVVHGKPNITNVESVYFGVTGDKVLKIPCEVTGIPEPTITWKREEKVVTSDDKISVSANAVYIKNPTEQDSNKFTCEARNNYGDTKKIFQAVISDFPELPDVSLNNYYYLKRGESADIKCLLTASDPQSVRWFVNMEKTDVVGLVYSLKNADFSDDGNYTCRLNNDEGSESLNYVVDVGYEPSFIIQPSPNFAWNGDKEISLDCSARAKPSYTTKWLYNGEELDNHETEVYITGWGAYTCNVSNVHGSVQHTFNVTTNGCLIDRTVNKIQNTPLIINKEPLNWPRFDDKQFYNEFLTVNQNKIITLDCSTEDQINNTFKTHPNANILKAECFTEDKFTVHGKIYKFEELQCKELVRPSYMPTKKSCMKNGEIIEVGFKLENAFLEVYEVCYIESDHRIGYTKLLMSDVNMGNIVGSSIMNQKNHTSTHDGELVKCQYNQRWLVSPVDVAFGPAQVATLSDKYNSIPVYEPCEGTSRTSWSGVETVVQNALYSMYNLIVWTGASHYDSNGIPRYLWKVAKFEDATFGTIVYVNAPNLKSSDIFCQKTTHETLIQITEINDQYIYYCSIEDFSKAFNVPLSEFDTL